MSDKTVLIVDDDAALTDSLGDILRDEGYVPVSAGTCSDALTVALARKPLVAVLDLKLPDGAGTNLLAPIKQNLPDTLCIIMTAYADLDSAIIALDRGAFQYLQKPVKPAGLLRVLERAFEVIRLKEEKKEAEARLRDSERTVRALLDAFPSAAFLMDTSGMIIAGNKVILQALNKQANELSGVHVSSLGQRSELENRKAKALEVIALKKAVRREERVDEKWFDTTIAPVTDSEGTVTRLAVFSRDITDQKRAEEERRRMEAQLSHSQKMEAIGTLAGGIAHDFNNLTQAILGYTEILLMERDPYDPDSAKLREIERAVKRASDLTQQLLTFSRKVESKAKPMDLNQSVRNVEKLLRRTIPRMIDVETDLAKDLKSINADPAQIEQILMNLGVNARDAMPEGGRLLIKTENANLDPGYCRVHPECLPGEYVLLTFSDTGQGMGEDVLTHIFEPFFTTKEIGKGTGLGLATVYGLVKNHQGHISCESELGKGTIFRIYLPSLETQAPELHDKAKVEPLPPGGSETILFVDDEESLQFLAEEVLTKMGYRLLKAWNGEQAITLYKANKEDISLVILDVIMPGMGGKRCLAELMKLDPMAKIIVASGYTDEEPKENFLKMGAKEFLSKPYKMKSILDVVRKVLDEA